MDVKFNKLKSLILCAFCCALTCLLSMPMFAIHIGPVPIVLGNLGVYFAAGLLGAKFGALSTLIYLILILFGLPFTASSKAGPAVFLGPTGGYLIGYVFMAMITGFFYRSILACCLKKFFALVISGCFGTLICYIMGTIQFMVVTKTGLMKSLVCCVFPFIIGDFLKICAAALVVPKVENLVAKFN